MSDPDAGFPTRRPRSELLDELRRVATSSGPTLSVYMDLTDSQSAAGDRFRASVEGVDVPSNVVERMAELISEAEAGNDALFAGLASASGPLVATTFPDPPRWEVIETADVARFAPFIESEQSLIHHVVAVIDAVGLTISASPRHGEPVRETLRGDNPEGAAELIAHVAHLTDTSLVLIVGTPEMLDRVHPLVLRDGRLFCPVLRVETSGADHRDADLADELVRWVADRTARKIVEALRLFRYFESHDAGADGVEATVDALRTRKASMLLVHDDPNDERQGWFAADPTIIGHDLADIERALPSDGARHALGNGRLVDVVVRSALAQNVPVMVVPSLPEDRLADGMGVVLHVEGFADTGLSELVES